MNDKYHRFTIDLEVELADPDALALFTTKVSPDGVLTPASSSEQVQTAVARLLGVFAQNREESGLTPLLASVTRRKLDEDANYAEVRLPRQGGRDADGKRRRI
ncbi:hypothetical protein [Microbacterium paludicola]|uniref:hypothetical protein n=1 Tax=Microbacterium paludicola TaxID=300019 RepID=UPI00119EA6E5|nr:hypothetical protein [Microbacterium paludicola]